MFKGEPGWLPGSGTRRVRQRPKSGFLPVEVRVAVSSRRCHSPRMISHGTVHVQRTIEAHVDRVYAAFADPKEREAYAAPSETAVFIYDETDFRVGGRDVARCGPKADPRFRVETRYIAIAPLQHVVSAETIHDGEMLLATNITTVEFEASQQRTTVSIAVQVASFVGQGMIDNTKGGHEGSLANMAKYLEC